MADENTMLEMDDESFSKLNGPPAADAAGDGSKPDDVAEVTEVEEQTETEKAAEAEAEGSEDGEGGDLDESGEGEKEDDPDAKAAETNKDEIADDKSGADPVGSKDPAEKKDEKPAAVELTEADYKAFYENLMTPFKANGKTIELRNPEEAKALMQMGANYTRKMQELQPHRKMLLMLQKNDLLNQDKLSYLIDLDKKNPEAIRKLVKDSGIDPLDLDTAEDSAYSPGNHSVTDEEADLRSQMEELVTSTPTGRETVSTIHDTWDDASKAALWENPSILTTIHAARDSGVYDMITAEVDRQITLGQIPPDTPFLEAYTKVGDAMLAEEVKKAGTNAGASGAQQEATARQPVATRAGAPKAKVQNGDKASAASPTRNSSKPAKDIINPLAMSDDEFLKKMEGRV